MTVTGLLAEEQHCSDERRIFIERSVEHQVLTTYDAVRL